jgi:hypothetical protein
MRWLRQECDGFKHFTDHWNLPEESRFLNNWQPPPDETPQPKVVGFIERSLSVLLRSSKASAVWIAQSGEEAAV